MLGSMKLLANIGIPIPRFTYFLLKIDTEITWYLVYNVIIDTGNIKPKLGRVSSLYI